MYSAFKICFFMTLWVALCNARCSTYLRNHTLKLNHNIPTNLAAGQAAVFSVSGITAKEIKKGATARLALEVYGISLAEEDFDICNELPCPIPAGANFKYTFTKHLPVEIPQGVPIDVSVQVIQDEQEIGCVDASISVEQAMLTSRFSFAEDEISYLFKHWVKQFKQKFADYEKRLKIFSDNLHRIAVHNAQEKSYKMAMNQFGHLEPSEFKRIYASGYNSHNRPSKRNFTRPFPRLRQTQELPTYVNWVEEGAVTPVKNQGACGSCWSFATTGALEGAYYRKYGKLISFSEQELVSCDDIDQGCKGGIMDSAYKWIEQNGGLCSEEDYPYEAAQGKESVCRAKSCTIVPNSRPSSFVDVMHDSTDLLSAVARNPVAVAIEADQLSFQFYSRGVLKSRCGNKLDHGVLVVGYGTEDGEDYWLVKNSWGPTWGDDGYIKLSRGVGLEDGGECGILLAPSYPLL